MENTPLSKLSADLCSHYEFLGVLSEVVLRQEVLDGLEELNVDGRGGLPWRRKAGRGDIGINFPRDANCSEGGKRGHCVNSSAHNLTEYGE